MFGSGMRMEIKIPNAMDFNKNRLANPTRWVKLWDTEETKEAMSKQARKFTVGQRVWLFDINHRVYPKGAGCTSGPIYAEHFRACRVFGIQGRSYLIASFADEDGKFASPVGFAKAEKRYLTDAEKAEKVYVDGNRYRIVNALERADAATLRKVAALIGYEPK
jgi:hypothetical protein